MHAGSVKKKINTENDERFAIEFKTNMIKIMENCNEEQLKNIAVGMNRNTLDALSKKIEMNTMPYVAMLWGKFMGYDLCLEETVPDGEILIGTRT